MLSACYISSGAEDQTISGKHFPISTHTHSETVLVLTSTLGRRNGLVRHNQAPSYWEGTPAASASPLCWQWHLPKHTHKHTKQSGHFPVCMQTACGLRVASGWPTLFAFLLVPQQQQLLLQPLFLLLFVSLLLQLPLLLQLLLSFGCQQLLLLLHTNTHTGYWMVPGIRQRERELVLQLTFKCSCSWTSCCLVSTSCFFWNSANSSCFCSSCCCLRRMSSCWSCCSLMAVSTTAPPDTDPTLGSVRRSTGPPPPPGLSPGLPPGNVKNNMASILAKCTAELLILYICSLIWITAFFPFPNY